MPPCPIETRALHAYVSTLPLANLNMDSQIFADYVLTLSPVELWNAFHKDPAFSESCRLLIRDNNVHNAYDAINHIVDSLWYKL